MLRSAVSVMVILLATTVAHGESTEVDFQREIRPLLSDKCFHCHGPDEENREAELRLDVADAAYESAIVRGAPDASELVARITSDDPDLRMPPADSGKALTKSEVELLNRWIAEGAEY